MLLARGAARGILALIDSVKTRLHTEGSVGTLALIDSAKTEESVGTLALIDSAKTEESVGTLALIDSAKTRLHRLCSDAPLEHYSPS